MLSLQDLIHKSQEKQPEAKISQLTITDDEVEKTAAALEEYAAEDTLIDKLAELAVVSDYLEGKYGK